MIHFSFDVSDLVNKFSLTKRDTEAIAQNAVIAATYATYQQIHKEANLVLHKTLDEYKRNINQPEFGHLQGTIVLTGTLPNMLENGASAFDMKTGFAKSSKKKTTKDGTGWYLTIPLRWATSEAGGFSSAFAGKMPKEIEEMSKGNPSQKSVFGITFQKGEGISAQQLSGTKFGGLPTRAGAPAGGGLSAGQRQPYEAKVPTFQGLKRSTKVYELRKGGVYTSFRRVSSKSADNSWIHRGLKANHFLQKGLDNANLQVVIDNAVGASLKEIGL